MIKTTGFDEFEKKLQDITKNAEELKEVKRVTFSELFPDEFVTRNTQCSSLSDLLNNSGFSIKTDEDVAAVPDDKWDDYIRSISEFDCWEKFLAAATEEWTVKRLGL